MADAEIEKFIGELTTTEVMGYTFPFKRFEGIDYNFWSFIPDDIEQHLEDMKNVKIRDDDVIICTYPRSGTNWTDEIVKMLLAGSAEYNNYIITFLDMLTKDKIEEMESPRVFISHFPLRYLPPQLKDKGRIICVFRNPKDLAVSLYHFMRKVKFAKYDGQFDDFLKIFYNGDVPGGTWFEHVLGWEKAIGDKSAKALLPIHYEDMKKDLRGHVEKISKFLGLPHNEELISKISLQCEFKNLTIEKTKNIPDPIKRLSEDKSNYLYWKGQAGNWKNWFTVAQNEEFDNIYKERMKNSNLTFKYEI